MVRVTTFGSRLAVMVLAALLLVPGLAYAGRITLAWDANSDLVSGYVVSYGTAPGVYTGSVYVGNQTSAVLLGLTNGVTYYFVVEAYSVWGGYSGPSDQVSGAPINLPPSITNPGDFTIKAGGVTLPISASDPDLDVLTYSAAGLPSGLAINAGTGVISGNVSAGTYTVTVTVTDDAAQASATFTMTVTVDSPPSLTNPGNRTNAEGTVVSLQLSATDPDGDPITYSATGLPAALGINPAGLMSGTPTFTSAGVYTVVVTAIAAGLSDAKTFTWTVTNTNRAPTLTNPGSRTHAEGAVVSLQLSATDPDGDPITYSATGLPAALGVNATTGRISGTLSFTSAGTYSVTATASDGTLSNSKTFTWTVTNTNRAPTLTNPGNRTNAEATAVSLQLSASDPDGDLLTYSATGLPAALSINAATGLISGTLSFTSAGAYSVTATASDGSLSNNKTFTWTVTNTNRAPTLTPPSNRTDAEGASISLQLPASDPDGGPLTYSVTGLPAALSVNATTGLISGTLSFTSVGTYSVTATASDGSLSNSQTFTWTVTNTNREPAVTNPGPQSASYGVALILALSATDPDGDSLTWSALNLPPGVFLNASTGVLSGVPTTISSFAVLITVSDASASAQAAFNWTVVPPMPPGPASPVSPSGSIGTSTPTFSWTAVTPATYYALSITDADPASPAVVWYSPAQAACASGTGTCSVPAPRSLTPGLDTWKVLTWNPGGYGPWSTTKAVVIDLADGAVPTPTPIAPSGSTATRTPTFTWNAVSGGATWYQLSVIDALGTVRELWYTHAEGCASSPCAVTPNTAVAIGLATWRVRAWRETGAGAWSGYVVFDAADGLPGKATLVAPSGSVSTATPSFTWNAVAAASYYLLQVTDGDNAATDRWYRPAEAGCPLGTGLCTVSSGIVLKAGAANWKVLIWNGSGYGPWSDARDILVELPAPLIPAPAALGPTGAIVSTKVPYQWTAVAGVQSYRLSIRNNGGAPTDWWYTPAAAGCDAGAECSVISLVDLVNGTAEWQVQVWTTTGYGPWSVPVALTVNIPAPPAPVAVSPTGPAGSSSPAFRWTAAANATLYYVKAYDVTGLRVDKWLTPTQAVCGTGGLCILDAGVTLSSGAGTWQVLAWNPTGYSPWSATTAFIAP